MTSRERAIERVRKLRAKANLLGAHGQADWSTTSEAEASALWGKIFSLMGRHGLSEADIVPPPTPPREPIVHYGNVRVVVVVQGPQFAGGLINRPPFFNGSFSTATGTWGGTW